MWNIKGGIAPHDYGTFVKPTSEKHDLGNKIDWMAGLELEIPLNQKFNIETGARYKNKMFIDGWKYDVEGGFIEIPVRFAYKQRLNDNISMHIGLGPYASYNLHSYNNSVTDNLQVGLEPSLAFNWKCLSLGVTYDVPIYNGTKPQFHNAVMATLGIRFKTSAWKYVGIGAAAVATVGAGVAMAVGAMNGDNTGTYSSSDYGSSSSSDSYSSSSSSSSSSEHSTSEMTSKNRDARTYSDYESQLIKMNTYWETQYNDNQRREIQQKMKSIRSKWESRGYRMQHSEWEDWDGRKR